MLKEKLEGMIKLTAEGNKKITTVRKDKLFDMVIIPESHDVNEYIEVPYVINDSGNCEVDSRPELSEKTPLTSEQQLEINEIKKMMLDLQKRLNEIEEQ